MHEYMIFLIKKRKAMPIDITELPLPVILSLLPLDPKGEKEHAQP